MAENENPAPNPDEMGGDNGNEKPEDTATPDVQEHDGDATSTAQSLDQKLAAGEQEERAQQVKFSQAVFTVPEDGYTFADVADATGLAKQNLDELVALNGEFPFGIRTSFVKGDKVNLPRGFSYVDVKGVKGGDVVDE
jgi:hypothetical protein